MSSCCGENPSSYPRQAVCPVNGIAYSRVEAKTLMHHLQAPWHWQAQRQGYYFCDDPACDVVYFGQDGSMIKAGAVRTRVGVKERSDDALVCYCFGVTYQDVSTDGAIRDYVVARTKASDCACEVRNPSGRCCLKAFPRRDGS